MNYKRKIIITTMLSISILLVIVIKIIVFIGAREQKGTLSVNAGNTLYAVDYGNDEKLMGASHNVFVGRLDRYIGSTDRGIGPEYQYEVEVIYNIKGDLQKSVTLNITNSDQENQIIPEIGNTYLFVTRYSSEYDWYTADPNASELMSTDKNMTTSQIQTLAESNERVYELLTAYINEIPLAADIYHNNTRNSFTSLSKEEKEVVLAKFKNLIPSRSAPNLELATSSEVK